MDQSHATMDATGTTLTLTAAQIASLHATGGIMDRLYLAGAPPAGWVWTAIDATGLGHWAAPTGGGGAITSIGSTTPTSLTGLLTGNGSVVGSTPDHHANWDTAYGWGNHALAGYLTSYTETDPIYVASAAHGIASGDIANWNTAYGWGNPSGVYLPLHGTADHATYAITAGSAGTATTAAGLSIPDALGLLTNNGSGGLSWSNPTLPVGANPTATATGSAINGAASTFMRSDAAPAIQTASGTQPGLLSSADWTTFNSKLSAEADTLATVTGRGATTGVNVSLSGGITSLGNTTSNWISWGAYGTGAPTFTTTSAGTKLILYPLLSGTQSNYSIGIDANTEWFGVPTATQHFKWYGGTTLDGTLDNTGLTIPNPVTGSQLVTGNLKLTGNTISSTNTNGLVTISPNGTGGVVLPSSGVGSLTVGQATEGTSETMQVIGSGSVTTNFYIGDGGSYRGMYFDDRTAGKNPLNASYRIGELSNANSRYTIRALNSNTLALTDMSDLGIFVINGGAVGVATTTPQAPLHIVGDVSATGGIYTGGSSTAKGTQRLDASGNATLATSTVGLAKDWGKLTSAPASTNEGDNYYNTTTHKRYCYDGTTWQAYW